jgi:hypothetical protein
MNVKRDDGAQLLIRTKERDIPLAKEMAFNDLQGMLAKMDMNDQEVIRFVRFWDGPRQIFNFDGSLAELLANTDVADVPWDSLHFPYEEFYLHFGCVLDSRLDIQGRVYKAEGAYVHVQGGPSFIDGFLPGALHIVVATRLVFPDYKTAATAMRDGISLKEPTYYLTISGREGETVSEAMNRGRDANLKLAAEADQIIMRSALDIAEHHGIDAEGRANASSLGVLERKYLRGEVLTIEAVKLIFNCIAYLTATPPEGDPEYPPEAPKSLIEKIEKAPTPKKKNILMGNMARLGFTKVYFVRDTSPKETTTGVPTGKHVRPHWRRGHWRSQPFGSGLGSRKLIWIRPCMVNPDVEDPSQDIGGREYKVNEKSGENEETHNGSNIC